MQFLPEAASKRALPSCAFTGARYPDVCSSGSWRSPAGSLGVRARSAGIRRLGSPGSRPAIVDYAAAIGDFLENMRFRQIDVLGYHTGSLIAAELAVTRPKQVRRVVLVSVPLLTEAERDSLSAFPLLLRPPRTGRTSRVNGSGWRIPTDPGAPLELVTDAFVEKLRNGLHPAWLTHAALQYPVRERLSLITQQVLLIRPRDELWDATLRAREVLPKARCIDVSEQGAALFEAAPELVADGVRGFSARLTLAVG